MTIDFDDRRPCHADGQELLGWAQRAIERTLTEDRITMQVNIGLTLTDDREMRSINLEFRGVDEPTDVLSFPMTDYDLRTETGGRIGDIDPATNELILGDIVVSVERARAQALAYGHSFHREFCFLVVHGMLHLLGYDHMTDADASVMRAMEENILAQMSLSRPG